MGGQVGGGVKSMLAQGQVFLNLFFFKLLTKKKWRLYEVIYWARTTGVS